MYTGRIFYRFALLATVLTFCVVVLGAYVRLSDAGLGCPDWPGCYGHIAVPETTHAIGRAELAFPGRPVQPGKAWKEMIHRYAAGTLGLIILGLAVAAVIRRRRVQRGVALPIVLLVLVCFQAALGMWTVTLLLKPLIVTGHLLGGMATLALLLLLVLREGDHLAGLVARHRRRLRMLAAIALAVLAVQIFLGAWTSTNYAALACPDFPTCQGYWWPPTDYKSAYTLWHGLSINYEYGVLDNIARVTIHVTHRLGALVTFLTLSGIALYLLLGERSRGLRALGALLLVTVCVQVAIGISIVMLHLPLPLADAHNAGAALLLLAVIGFNHAAWQARDSTADQS